MNKGLTFWCKSMAIGIILIVGWAASTVFLSQTMREPGKSLFGPMSLALWIGLGFFLIRNEYRETFNNKKNKDGK